MNPIKAASLALLLFLPFSVHAESPETVVEGHVVSVVSVGSFILSDVRSEMTVYFRDAAADELLPGDRVRVRGVLVDDWMNIGTLEIQAISVETVGENNTLAVSR